MLMAASAASAASADHHDLYRAGLRSFEFGYWREALVFFEGAAREQPHEGSTVREYGMWKAPYLPHFQQGAALYRLGEYAQALEALAESESQGAIRRRRNKKYYQRLLELRDEIRKAIERDVGQLHRGAAADYETFETLKESPALEQPELIAAVPEINEIDRILDNTTSSLKDASLIDAAAELQRAMSLLDQAREGMETIARSIRKREIELEEERQRAVRQALLDQITNDVRLARELIARGECQQQAIELLEKIERHGELAPSETDDAGASALDLLLAQAHLQCEHLALGNVYLGRAQDQGQVPRPELSALAKSLAPQNQQPTASQLSDVPKSLIAALSDYLLAAGLAVGADCRELEITRLIEGAHKSLTQEKLGSSAGASISTLALPTSLPFAYTPYLVLARAHRNCAARNHVETYRILAGDLGRASEAELAEIDAWLTRHPKLEPYSGSYALLVGAYDYDLASGWPALYKPGEDVREIQTALETHGFQVQTLVNPTSAKLENTLGDFFAKYGKKRSHRLVFYYAGHGHTVSTEHGVKLGYIVPVDAGDPKQDPANLKRLIGMERFREYARGSNADDLLFMFDSCFAGTVFKATRSCVPPDCLTPGAEALTLRERVSRPVRMFLTAGSENQMVPDESVFRQMVTRALAGEADSNRDGFMLGSEIGSFVQNTTLFERAAASSARTTSPLLALLGQEPAEPQWGTLSEGNFGQGDILFHTPEDASPSSQARQSSSTRQSFRGDIDTQLAYWAAASTSAAPQEFRRYLERFPEGHFAPLAEWILDRTESIATP